MRTLVFAVAFAASAPLAAQGWIEPITPIRPVPIGRIEKVRTAVQVAVTGRVARVTVEEWFRNAGPQLDEAAYLYPLPGEAVFTDYSLSRSGSATPGRSSTRPRTSTRFPAKPCSPTTRCGRAIRSCAAR